MRPSRMRRRTGAGRGARSRRVVVGMAETDGADDGHEQERAERLAAGHQAGDRRQQQRVHQAVEDDQVPASATNEVQRRTRQRQPIRRAFAHNGPESTRSLKGSASPPERGSAMAKARVNGIEIDYEVSGHGRPVLQEP